MVLPARRGVSVAVVCLWIVVAVALSPLASKLTGAEKNDAESYLPGSAESVTALHQQREFSPQDVASAVIVYHRSNGITAADRAAVTSDLTKILGNAKVKRGPISSIPGAKPGAGRAAYGPLPAKDGQALLLTIPLRAPADSDVLSNSVQAIRDEVSHPDGLQVQVAGPAGSQADSNDAFEGLDTRLLLIAGIGVIAILLVVYRSPILWFVPVISAVLSLFLAQAVIYLFIKYAGLTVNGLSSGILDVLVFGAGTDYALLLVSRYREELHRHESKYEAMAFALRRTSPAIVASAGTVIIALLCLLMSRLNSDAGIGAVCALGIGCTLLIMSTFLPALLVVVGRRAFWPFVPRYGTESHQEAGFWSRVGRTSARRPRTVWIATTLLFGVFCLGMFSLQAHGLSNADQYTNTPESVTGQKVIAAHYPVGAEDPAVVIGPARDARALQSAVTGTSGISGVVGVATKNNLVQIQAGLSDPVDSSAAYATIDRLRDRVSGVDRSVVVGGTTALNKDVADAARFDRDLVIPVVLVVVFIVLGLLLRAVVAPLLLIATVGLSFGAALGISGFFFAHVFHFGGADTAFPLYAFIFLVALGIDYNIFLMTRVREEVPQRGNTEGVVRGVAVTGGVITSAGVVLAATFCALATLPLVQLVEVGFAVAVGVLLDTFLVRSVLVPALSIDVGKRIWWPSRLARATDAPAVTDETVAAG